MKRLVLPLLLAACNEPEPAPAGTTGPEPQPPASSGSCEAQPDNVLRFDCAFELGAAGPLDVEVLEDGAVIRTFASDEATTSHAVTLWGIPADTELTVRAVPRDAPDAAWEESIVTEPLPAVVEMDIHTTGTPSFDSALFPFQCGGTGHIVLVRTHDEQVLWYQDGGDGLDMGTNIKVDGFELADDGGSVGILMGHLGLREFGWDGAVRLEGGRYLGLERPTHHDLHRRDGHVYALNAMAHTEADGTYVLDGVYVFDDAGDLVAEWDLRDHLTPSGGGFPGGYWSIDFPGAIDYTHANNIYVDEAGDWYLSFRAIDTVLKVRGDLDAPDFGEILWSLTTSDTSPFPSDFTVISTSGATDELSFSDQHHANLDPSGRLLLFDNRSQGTPSRALAFELDEVAGTADIVDAWQLDVHCPIQGSVFRLPNDHVVVTCPTQRMIYEFAPGSDEPVFTMQPFCLDDHEKPLVVRAQPIDLE